MITLIAIIMLNIIALIAILVANREVDKALREIDKLSSSRASRAEDSLITKRDRARF